MKLEDALRQFGPVRGQTTVIASVLSGDFSPVAGGEYVNESLAEARAKLEQVKHAQEVCNSDWAYWGLQGDISYWTAIVSILEAAAITGPEALPDLPFEAKAGIVMDACAEQEAYGRKLLELAKAQARSA